ncbi:MAG: leucyl aminopeptidase [Candidatus Accumulibacter sp.]|jgi:leucyl aminopeptidase|nr:leucyl aminopeptidase [Accumulibacter sp.]
MKFSIKSVYPDNSACLVAGVFESRGLTDAARAIDEMSGNYLSGILKRGDMEGKAGSSLFLYDIPSLKAERVLLVGLGKREDFGEKAFTDAIRAAIKALCASGAKEAAFLLMDIPLEGRSVSWKIRQAVMAVQDSLYRFEDFKSEKAAPSPSLNKIVLVVDSAGEAPELDTAREQGLAIAEGAALARTLGNLPGNVCTPAYLAKTARRLAKEHDLDCRVLERGDMEKLGMNSLLSVARGSHQPPKLIVLTYKGGKTKPLVFVGKGITFDSGGISLKPGEGMDEMKFDMSGAASVLGAIKAAALMRLPLNLTVVIPAAENLPGGNASKPGDIVTSLSGQTIEILNTDAEGRLILCDALTYAERFEPETVIDVATLTGACVIALGHVATGVFSNNDELAREILSAGNNSLDRAWQLPLWNDYQEQIKSGFADMANVGGRPAGSITAACFLSRFTKKYAWAHLDIAGTAWKSGVEKGSTGRPVSLLAHFLLKRAGKLY